MEELLANFDLPLPRHFHLTFCLLGHLDLLRRLYIARRLTVARHSLRVTQIKHSGTRTGFYGELKEKSQMPILINKYIAPTD